MKTSIKLIALAVVAQLLNSCVSPRPVFRLNPTESVTVWDRGKEFVSIKANSFVVHTAFHKHEGGLISFDIEVINEDSSDFLVSPEQFVLSPLSWETARSNFDFTAPQKALDPEHELRNIDISMSQQDASHTNYQLFALGVALADVTYSVATINKEKSDAEIVATEVGREAVYGGLAVNDDIHYQSIQRLTDLRYIWEATALRKTTLFPNNSIRGLIYFNEPSKYIKSVRLTIPINNMEVNMDFAVNVY